MNILGIGTIFTQGLGITAWEHALRSGWQKPADAAYLVDLDSVTDRTLLKRIRRADKLSKMAVLAAADALADSGIGEGTGKKLGIILATAFGAHVTTFSFLDDILDYGEANVSPTTFSNSVHNAAASYVSSALNIHGPTLTVTQFRFSFQAALQLAKSWLDQGRCDYLLVGAVDQYGEVLGYVADQMLTAAPDGMIRPFTFNPTCQVPGEGAVFFLLGNEPAGKRYCAVEAVHVNGDPDQETRVDINIIDADGMLPDESTYRASLAQDIPVAAYAPLHGSMMTGSAFNLAAAALMLKLQTHFATPVQDNPHGLLLVEETRPTAVRSIRCIGFNCLGEKSAIYVGRQ